MYIQDALVREARGQWGRREGLHPVLGVPPQELERVHHGLDKLDAIYEEQLRAFVDLLAMAGYLDLRYLVPNDSPPCLRINTRKSQSPLISKTQFTRGYSLEDKGQSILAATNLEFRVSSAIMCILHCLILLCVHKLCVESLVTLCGRSEATIPLCFYKQMRTLLLFCHLPSVGGCVLRLQVNTLSFSACKYSLNFQRIKVGV